MLKNNAIRCSLFLTGLLAIGATYIYADKSTDYVIDEVRIECLFEAEQEILKNYNMNINTEDIAENISEVKVTEENVFAVEEMIASSIDCIKVIEYEEEYYTNNKLASRELSSASDEYYWPVLGYDRVSSPYGWRICPVHKVKEFHGGIDIPAPSGTPVLAAKSGTVVLSEYSGSYGHYVIIEHSEKDKTLYAHLVKRNVSVGDTVNQGDIIGGVGSTGYSTGNHLHFEVWTGNDKSSRINPMNCY